MGDTETLSFFSSIYVYVCLYLSTMYDQKLDVY